MQGWCPTLSWSHGTKPALSSVGQSVRKQRGKQMWDGLCCPWVIQSKYSQARRKKEKSVHTGQMLFGPMEPTFYKPHETAHLTCMFIWQLYFCTYWSIYVGLLGPQRLKVRHYRPRERATRLARGAPPWVTTQFKYWCLCLSLPCNKGVCALSTYLCLC